MGRMGELEAFRAVAETGGFTAAALKLGRTTSSVSKQVRAIEERLGVRLLNRTTRRVALTERNLSTPMRHSVARITEQFLLSLMFRVG